MRYGQLQKILDGLFEVYLGVLCTLIIYYSMYNIQVSKQAKFMLIIGFRKEKKFQDVIILDYFTISDINFF